MQTQAMNTQISVGARYRSATECVRRVHAEQGLVSFWRGNSATVARYVICTLNVFLYHLSSCLSRYIPNQALNFSLKDRFKVYFGAHESAQSMEVL